MRPQMTNCRLKAGPSPAVAKCLARARQEAAIRLRLSAASIRDMDGETAASEERGGEGRAGDGGRVGGRGGAALKHSQDDS